MDNLNGIHIIDCKHIGCERLEEIQDTKEFKHFAEQFGNGMRLNGIVYLINTGIEEAVVRCNLLSVAVGEKLQSQNPFVDLEFPTEVS